MNVIFASNNQGKVTEIKRIIDFLNIQSLKEVAIKVDVVEDADSFYGNALKKAKAVYEQTTIPTIADDSGLCIEVLDGQPGIHTARFMGENITDMERNEAILDQLRNQTNRACSFHCVLVYYDGTSIITFEGIQTGRIALQRRGINGFGFDEIFETTNGKTMAELTTQEKDTISARYLAITGLKEQFLQDLKF